MKNLKEMFANNKENPYCTDVNKKLIDWLNKNELPNDNARDHLLVSCQCLSLVACVLLLTD
jgi:hypothetical protein